MPPKPESPVDRPGHRVGGHQARHPVFGSADPPNVSGAPEIPCGGSSKTLSPELIHRHSPPSYRWLQLIPAATRLGFGLVAGLLVLTLVGGCKVGPEFQKPVIAKPTGWRQSQATSDSLANVPWWELFNDPALTNLISTALSNNQDLRIAAARIEQARGNYRSQRAAWVPWLNGSADWARGRSGLTGQTAGQFDVFGLLSYEVDFWGRLRRLTESARAQLLASEEGQKTVYIGLVAEVAATCFNLRALDEQMAIARRTYASRTNTLELTRIKYDNNNGIVSELDVRQAETQVFSAQSSMAQLERNIGITENALSLLMGANPGPIARGRSLVDQPSSGSAPAGVPSDLLLRRPDIRAAEQQLIAAYANIGAARAAYFPTISLSAALGVQSLQLEDLFSAGASKAWKFTPQIVGPIFNGGRIRAGVQVAEARKSELLAAYELAIQNAFREVEDALVSITKLREQISVGEANVAAERRRLVLSLDRYENGVSSYLEVLDAERSLFSAELGLAQYRGDLLAARAQLYKALGGGWNPHAYPS